jgi:polyisoprenoid-binding protein YceI
MPGLETGGWRAGAGMATIIDRRRFGPVNNDMKGERMHVKRIFAMAVLGVAVVMGPVAPRPAKAAEYKVDNVHSSVVFRIKHLGVSYFYGRFNDVSGKVVFNQAEPDKSEFDIIVKSGSVDTNNEKRDQHLKSPDFFNARQYPEISFKSKSVKATDEGKYEVTGDLTLHGVTKSLTITAEHVGSGKDRGGAERIGFETTFTIKRTDFDMGYMAPDALGDEVRLTVSLGAAG